MLRNILFIAIMSVGHASNGKHTNGVAQYTHTTNSRIITIECTGSYNIQHTFTRTRIYYTTHAQHTHTYSHTHTYTTYTHKRTHTNARTHTCHYRLNSQRLEFWKKHWTYCCMRNQMVGVVAFINAYMYL